MNFFVSHPPTPLVVLEVLSVVLRWFSGDFPILLITLNKFQIKKLPREQLVFPKKLTPLTVREVRNGVVIVIMRLVRNVLWMFKIFLNEWRFKINWKIGSMTERYYNSLSTENFWSRLFIAFLKMSLLSSLLINGSTIKKEEERECCDQERRHFSNVSLINAIRKSRRAVCDLIIITLVLRHVWY
jgi:hypothetical protein